MKAKTLIVGYGNPDREDDGVAWHILDQIARRLNLPEPGRDIQDLSHRDDMPDLLCVLQLDPDLAEVLADYDQVCFVDAHTGAYHDDIRFEQVRAGYQASPFTHHMSPETCLALADTLYGSSPQAVVVSVRGYEFGFSYTLSAKTARLAEGAVDRIIVWLKFEN